MENFITYGGYFISVVTAVRAIYERITSSKDKADIKASVRNWQHQAKGMSSAIYRVARSCNDKEDGDNVWNSFSNKKDVGITLSAIHEISESMAESLYESRFFTEEELKEILRKDKEKNSKE